MRGGEALHPVTMSTTISVSGGRGGEVILTAGPYAEAKEVLAGYFVLETADLDEAVVRIGARVAIDDVIAVYVDNAAAEADVIAAIAVIDEADLGDEDAELTVGDAQDHDLAWYATQELPFLLDLL